MNKQEAIEKLKSKAKPHWLDEEVYGDNCIKSVELGAAIDIVNQIDESKRPAVPRYVADFYESIKDDFEWNLYNLYVEFHKRELPDDLHEWFANIENKPIETLVNTHQFGYEVEKEKLYTVEIPNPNGGTHLVLCKDCDGKLFVETFLIDDWETFGKCKLTEAEIKKEFSWAWQFAKEWKDEDREEKLYTVELPSPNCPTDDHYILSRLKNGKIIINRYCIEQWKKFGDCQLTESEIKQDFDWAWQFAKEVEND